MTGPEAVSLATAAAELSDACGIGVAFRDETLEEAYASRARHDAPRFEVEGWVSSYVAVARGELDVVADTVPRLTGHAAQTLPEFLVAHPESCAHLHTAS